MNTELLPCPFCGDDAYIHISLVRISCSECPITMAGVQGEKLLIETWNTRAPTKRELELEEKITTVMAERDALRAKIFKGVKI